MKNLHIELHNCYGIGELQQDINFGPGRNCCIIYAPNGTMKTSFTRTISKLIDGKQPEDAIFNDRKSKAVVTIDGQKISANNCYVYNNLKEDGNSSITTFLANKQLKENYDTILQSLQESWGVLRHKLTTDSRSSDCEEEILKTFSPSAEISIFECLNNIYQLYFPNDSVSYPLYTFKYNDVFDKAGKVKKFVEDNQVIINSYFSEYQNVIKSSILFSKGADSFGTYQASLLLKSVEDNRFFKASHHIILKDGTKIDSKDQFSELLDKEIRKVLEDEKLKKSFDKLEKKLGGNNELRQFKDTIIRDPILVSHLTDYEAFRKEVLLGYLYNNHKELHDFIVQYQLEKAEIQKIIAQANKSLDKWKAVIDLFNTRFFVPFEVYIKNQSDIILKEKSATLGFRYRESEEQSKEESQSALLSALSTGEARAFHILQNLFEIEARKCGSNETLIIFDDIADSFDYKNKYAIIEYLADLIGNSKFALIILTHNFDFYRTVVSRLGVKHIYFANKEKGRKIKLCTGIFNTDIIKNRFISKVTDKRAFIGLIPFVRNLMEYSQGTASKDYLLLTSCLHQKSNTKDITIGNIFEIFKSNLTGMEDKSITFIEERYINVLFQEASFVMSDLNEVDLANKLVLSIAIRIKAEQILFDIISEEHLKELKPGKNQTGELVKLLKKYYTGTHGETILLMNRVIMLTSENIHVNNFMFEPLVDISSLHLKQLYNDVCNYCDN